MDGYKHYIRTNEAGVIILGFSSAFPEIATPQVGDICIEEDGPRHFQQVWPESLMNERGQFHYRLVNGARVERSQAELDAEEAMLPPPPPAPETRIAELEATVADLTQLLAEKGITP